MQIHINSLGLAGLAATLAFLLATPAFGLIVDEASSSLTRRAEVLIACTLALIPAAFAFFAVAVI